MRFTTILAASGLSASSLVAAQEYPYQLICGGQAQSGAVDCGNGFCCRKNAACNNPDTNGVVKCDDGTVALPYNIGLAPSLANVLETASPAAYTSILAIVTGNRFIPPSILAAITAGPEPSSSSNAAASYQHSRPSTPLGPVFAVLGVWGIAAVGGAAWVFAH